ncbi:MAG: DHH family phosphoesterase [Oscillospiraceae bacterium]
MSVTIRELTDGRSKISVRTPPEVDSCAICAVYGGGGHKMASGCTLACDPETAVKRSLQPSIRCGRHEWDLTGR